jgi:two-component system CheB/CheR fusion protein
LSKKEREKSKRNTGSNNNGKNIFPIVGIGASAGGLEAIKSLLQVLPQNTGLAFVIVQHLAANQESMLPEILSRFTKMPVLKVLSGMHVEPNHVYVIPAGKIMTISNGVLKLKPKGVSFKPIDEFLRSLATSRKTQAIGIVLSGTGTDGTEGLKFIKAESGITFVQDPNSAQYPDMPKSAIAAETAYFILPPERMAKELAGIAKHPEIIRQQIEAAEPKEQYGTDTQTIFTLLKASFGINFKHYKKSTTNRRITRRMVLKKIESRRKYVAYLRDHKEELQALFDDMLIGVTGFFREPKTFELLKEQVFPKMIDKKRANQPVRIWVPGCSSGEEVYSVAMTLQEFLEEKTIVETQIQIFGTDVNQKNVEKARKGIYLNNIEEHVSEGRLNRFFTSINGNYQVVKQIRDMCIFAKHDLTSDPPFSNLDLIICRNLLIYFDTTLQDRIIPVFHYALKPDGYLVLGEAETVGKFAYLFEPIKKKGIVFRKKLARQALELNIEPFTVSTPQKLLKMPKRTNFLTFLEAKMDKLLISEYVPASLLLNGNLDVLVFRGKMDPYISIEPGAASLNATRIVRKELRPSLQTALYRAKKRKKGVNETVRFAEGKKRKTVNIQITPIKLPKAEEPFFLALFTETVKEKPSVQTKKSAPEEETEDVKDQQIKELSEDLNSTKQTLQTVIEQQEATNEELRSAMEEVQSSNEELMSTNEELETSKEELQSTNEELTTLNDELKNRNQSLSLLNDDLANLMNNVDTAVVIVDSEFKIRRFTGSAQELLRLMPSDVDRSITDIRLGIPLEELEKSLAKVERTLETVRKEIRTEKGRWYQMRIRPYLTQEKKIGGAVLSFANVTEMKDFEGEKKLYTDNLEQKVEEQAGKLVAAENMATIGRTAGMVGHDIRNPLQTITGELYLAKSELKKLSDGQEKENLKESLDAIEEQADYINKIVSDLQDFAKPLAPVLEEVDFESVLQEVLSSVNVPDNINVECSMRRSLPHLKLDHSYLQRILQNLVINAVQAMPDGGNLLVIADFKDGKAVVAVEDTGMGIPKEIRGKLFTPLVTTKSKGQGFGLAVVNRLVEALRGTVTFESETGKGTRFTLEFPQ